MSVAALPKLPPHNVRMARPPRLPRRHPAGRFLVWSGLPLVLLFAGIKWLPLNGQHVLRNDLLTHTVRYEKLQLTIEELGAVDSAANRDIICRVKSRVHGSLVASIIIWVIPEGSAVKKEQLLMKLDDSGLYEDLKAQQLAVTQARSAWIQSAENAKIVASLNQGDVATARVAALLAELDLLKYVKGEYEETRKDVEGRIAEAQSELEMWRERTAWSRRMAKKGFLTPNQVRTEENHRFTAQLALEGVREELRVLQDYTRRRSLVELEGNLAESKRTLHRFESQGSAKELQAAVDRLTKQSVYLQEQERLRQIQEQIEFCSITAPQDGIVVYAPSDPSRSRSGAPQAIIAQGETVREGQKLMSIPDLSKMIVTTGVHESLLAHIRGEEREPTGFGDSLQAALLTDPNCLSRLVGQCAFDTQRDAFRDREERKTHAGEPVRIQLNAFPDHPLHGHVKRVSNVPLVRDWIMTGAKIYPTEVEIDEPLEGLKPGMTAEVTIYASESLEHVLAVPGEASLGSTRRGEMGKCFVLTAQGPQEREVQVGLSSETQVEIKAGLEEAEEVVLNPQTLLRDKEMAAR